MAARSWRWLRTRILGLLDRPFSFDVAGSPVFTTRLQTALHQSTTEKARARR